MPRLGSRFFDSYNGQIDRLRRRRGENVEAFNSFVKMRQDMGEVASVEEMEKFRNALGGGESYFLSALPTKSMLAETNKAMVASRADLQETRAQNRLKTTTDELDLVKSIAGTVIDQDFTDVTENGGRSKIANAFKTSGNENLYKEYEGMLPNIMDTARTEQTARWVQANGFNNIETKEGKESLMALAPAWMKNTLNTQGDAIIKRANDAKIAKAITEVQADMAGIINDAAGDASAVEKSVKARLIQKLGPLYSEDIFATMKEIVAGDVSLDLASRTTKALANVKVDDELLVGAKGNEARLREMAKQALIKAGLTNPTEADIDAAVAQLKTQQRSALRSDFETRLQNAVNKAESMTSDEAKLIDGDTQIDEVVTRILSGVYPDYENMSAEDKAEAVARVRAIVVNKSALANEAEQIADDEFVISALANDPILKSLYEGGPVADKMNGIYDQINLIRGSRGLPELSREDLEAKYKKYVDSNMKLGASVRYSKEVATATKNADDKWNAMTSGHKKAMEGIARELPDNLKVVVSIAESRWIPRSTTGYVGFQDVLLAMIDKEEPPKNAIEAAALADKIAMSLNWLPAGSGRSQMIAEALRGKDLIRPGTPAGELVEDESGALGATLLPILKKVELTARDVDVTSKKNQMLEKVDEWEQALISDITSPGIKPLLNDMARVQEHIAKIRKEADKARKQIREATPDGAYSFMVFSQSAQGGVFIVSDQQKDRENVIANGFEPGATYRKLENGEFEKILNATVSPTSNTPTNNNQLSTVDPASTPFVQDLQALSRSSDLNSATDRVASRISSGGFSDQDLPASGPLFRSGIYQYFFGSDQPDAQRRLRVSQDLAAFLRSPQAKEYLQRNPDTYSDLFADPLVWATSAGFGQQ